MPRTGSQSNLTPISTILTAPERLRVDAAASGLYKALHRTSMDDVIRDLRENRAGAVLMSVSVCGERQAERVANLVREFPRVPALALLTDAEKAAEAVLSLGHSGVRRLIDVRRPSGWHELRDVLMTTRTQDVQRLALAQLASDLRGVPDDCWRFFQTLFSIDCAVGTVRDLCDLLEVTPNTMMSRFFRAGIPSPKAYLAMARLVRAAELFENPGLSVANVSNHLQYSSPQSFGRHVRQTIGISATKFRTRYDGEGMLQRFRDEYVTPFLPILREFRPLTAPAGYYPLPRGRKGGRKKKGGKRRS